MARSGPRGQETMKLDNQFESDMFWLEQLPLNLRPNERQIEELEKLRRHYRLPNNVFLMILSSSPAITLRVQENVYANAKQRMPNASEKQLLEAVFKSRVFPQNPEGLRMTDEEIQRQMQHIDCLEDLIKRITEIETQELRFQRDLFGIGRRVAKRIDGILQS